MIKKLYSKTKSSEQILSFRNKQKTPFIAQNIGFFAILILFAFILVCCNVNATIFNYANNTQIIAGHEVKLVGIARGDTCLFSVDEEKVSVGVTSTKTIKEVIIWVKDAFVSHSEDGIDFCEAIVTPASSVNDSNFAKPKRVTIQKEAGTTTETPTIAKDEPKQDEKKEINVNTNNTPNSTENQLNNNPVDNTGNTIINVPKKEQSIFKRIIEWILSLF